jgi:hypothetical protein
VKDRQEKWLNRDRDKNKEREKEQICCQERHETISQHEFYEAKVTKKLKSSFILQLFVILSACYVTHGLFSSPSESVRFIHMNRQHECFDLRIMYECRPFLYRS